MKDVPLTLGYDDSLIYGRVTLSSDLPLPNAHEYFIAPQYAKDSSGEWTILSYSLVHRSLLPSAGEMERREEAA